MKSSNPIVAAFIESASESISKMAMFTLTIERIELVEAPLGSFELVSAMTIGEQDGSLIVMSFERQLGQYLVASMLGLQLGEVEEFLEDGIGELLNVIAGGAKSRLISADHNLTLMLTVPVTSSDTKPPIDPPDNLPGVTIMGRVGAEPMSMTIWSQGIDVGL